MLQIWPPHGCRESEKENKAWSISLEVQDEDEMRIELEQLPSAWKGRPHGSGKVTIECEKEDISGFYGDQIRRSILYWSLILMFKDKPPHIQHPYI